MNVKDCFERRLLREIPPDSDKAKRSLEVAVRSLKDARDSLKYKIVDITILKAYMTMFHSARALLYREGVQEKSHFAIYVYLKERFSNRIPLNIINLLNIHRIERHEALYGLEFSPTEEDAKAAIEDASTFLKEIRKILHDFAESN